jgi:hypothetical protein
MKKTKLNLSRKTNLQREKTITKTRKTNNYVFILFNGQNGTKINWEYGFNGTPNLPKLDFLDELKKLGNTYTFNLPIYNLNYYMKPEDPKEAKLVSAINHKYKPYTDDVDFTLDELDYKNICQNVYNDVKAKYGNNEKKNAKYIVIGHSFGVPLARLFSKLYVDECVLCVCLDSVPYVMSFFKKYDEHENKDEVLKNIPDNAKLQENLQIIKDNNTTQEVRNKKIIEIYELYSYLLCQYRMKYYDPKLYVPTLIFKAFVNKPFAKERNRYNKKEENLMKKSHNLREFIYFENAEHYLWRDPKVSKRIIEFIKANI